MSKEEKLITWGGYFPNRYYKTYSVKIPESKFLKLWEKFKNFDGSHEDFYFKYVNREKILIFPRAMGKSEIPKLEKRMSQ